ncbi:hypothetical protein LTR27_003485 [Elasticomyces elasticus]|nr:hypothetical protein LTR27_003485 [Elasticomyces elasticus]
MSSPRRSRRKSESYYQLTSTPRQDQALAQGQAQGQNTMDVTVRVRTSASPVPTEAGQQDSQYSPNGKPKSRPRPHSRRSRHSQGSLGTLEPVREDEDDASCVSSSGLLVHKEAKMLRRKPLPAPHLPSPPTDQNLGSEIDRMVERNRREYGIVGARPGPALSFQSYDGSNGSAVYSASTRSSGFEKRVSYPSPLDSTSGHFSPVSRPDWAGMAGMPLPNMPYISPPAENPNAMRRGGLMSTIPPKFKPPTWSPETGPLMGVVQKPDPTAMPPRLRSDVSGSLVPAHAFGGFQGQWTDAPRKLGEGTRPMPVLIDWWEPEGRQQLQRTKEKRRFWRRGGSETAVSVKVGGPMHHGPVVGQGKERQPSTAVSESVLDSPLLQQRAVASNMLDGQRPQTTQEVRSATDFSGRKPLRYRQSAPQIRNGVSTTSVSVRASFASDRPTPSLNSAEVSPITTHSRIPRNGSETSSLLLHRRASIAGADRSRAKKTISPTPSLDDTYTRLRMLEATCQRFEAGMFSSNTTPYMANLLWSYISKRRELCSQAQRLHHRAKELREHASMGIEQDGYRAALYKLALEVEDLEIDVKWAVVGMNELVQGHATAVGIRRVQPGEVKVVDVPRRARPEVVVETRNAPPLKEEARVLKPKKSLFSLFSRKKEDKDMSVNF